MKIISIEEKSEFLKWFSWLTNPANTGHSPNNVSMLGQRRRRWANIETTLGECPVFPGKHLPHIFLSFFLAFDLVKIAWIHACETS